MARGRASNGSGCVVKLKGRKKPYQIQYTVDGVRKYKSGFATMAEASAALRKITASVDSHDYVDPQKMRLAEWLQIWLKEYCSNIKESTMIQYEGYVRVHIAPALGNVRLCDLNQHKVQAFVNHISRKRNGSDKPLAYKTLRNIHGCLSTALRKALEIKYIKENPATGCAIPKVDTETKRQAVRPFDSNQIPVFMAAIKGARFESIYRMAIETGMRLSEILGLQWSKVNFQRHEITVDQQLPVNRRSGAPRILTSTKSRNVRVIIVPEDVIELLKERRKAQLADQMRAGELWDNQYGLCFTNELGGCLPHTPIEHEYKRIVTSIGLPNQRFHDLRHTFATEAIRAGVDYETLSRHLGHFSVGFTLDVYGHVTDTMKRDASKKMQAAIQMWRQA